MTHESGELRPCACGYHDCPASRWTQLGPEVGMRWHTDRARLLLRHLEPATGAECHALILVDSPEGLALRDAEGGGSPWHVETWDPLTLSPSIACSCGWHGFVREGQWVPA